MLLVPDFRQRLGRAVAYILRAAVGEYLETGQALKA